MTKDQKAVYNALIKLPAEEAVNILLDYYGTALLTIGLREHMEAEGYDPEHI